MILSIIIPVYNVNDEYLLKCFNSIKRQMNNDIEVIVIDDGSTIDNVKFICDSYKNIFEIIHTNNNGVSSARNLGISKAKGKWISFVDPDDWVSEDYIKNIIKEIDDTYNIILFNYALIFANKTMNVQISENGFILQGKNYDDIKDYYFGKKKLDYDYNHNVVWNKIYKKDFLIKNNINFPINVKIGEDKIFNLETLIFDDKIKYFSIAIYNYRVSYSSVCNKYNPNITSIFEQEYNSLKLLIDKYKLNKEYKMSLDALLVKIWPIILRLNYFNKNNKNSYRQIKKELNILRKTNPFKNAIENFSKFDLDFKYKFFAFFIKHRMWFVCKSFLKIFDSIKNKKLTMLD